MQKLNDALRDLERALDANKDYRSALDNIHISYNAEMQLTREEGKAKVDCLLAQVDRLQKGNDNLRAENNRKPKVVDMFMEK